MSEAWKAADDARARMDEAYLALKQGVKGRVPDEDLSKLRQALTLAARRFGDLASRAAPLRGPSKQAEANAKTLTELKNKIAMSASKTPQNLPRLK